MAQFDRRQAIRAVVAAGAAGLLAGCGSDEPTEPVTSDEPVRIGLLIPQTGALKKLGAELANGFQLYLDLNERRLGGRPVNLIAADERESPESGQNAVEQLLARDVVAIVGVANSSLLLAVRDRVEQAKVPVLSAGGAPPALRNVQALWCTSHVDDEPGYALGPYVARQVPRSAPVAIIAPTSPAGQAAVHGFRQGFGPTDPRISDPVVWTEPDSTPGRGFFRSALAKVRQMGAAAVFCHYSGQAATELIKQLRDADLRPRIYGSGLLTEGTVLAELAEDAEGIRTALNYSADLDNAANRLFAPSYRRAYGVAPSVAAVASYDAAHVLDRAIRLAGQRVTPQEVNRSIGRVGQVDSPRGTWQFNALHAPQQRWYLREVRRDGKVLANVTVNELSTLG